VASVVSLGHRGAPTLCDLHEIMMLVAVLEDYCMFLLQKDCDNVSSAAFSYFCPFASTFTHDKLWLSRSVNCCLGRPHGTSNVQ
jgi:hypothetical protein